MPACAACHAAKVSCDQKVPQCTRCATRNMICIPRLSRQGQGPKKRKRGSQTERDGLVASSEDAAMVQHDFGGQHHYGVRYLIYSWTSIALARRSFSLLSRASKLAASCDLAMDEVLSQERRSFLEPLMWNQKGFNSSSSSSIEKTTLQWTDLPPRLRRACSIQDNSALSNRFLFVRESNRGQSHFLTTQAFSTHICSQYAMDQTWKANDKSVVKLYLQGPEDFRKFTNAVTYQMMRYTEPHKHPEHVRVKGVNVTFSSGAVEMDMIYTLEIVDLEQSFYVCEFLHPMGDEAQGGVTTAVTANTRSSRQEDSGDAETDPFALFDGIDDLFEDDELAAFVDYINGAES